MGGPQWLTVATGDGRSLEVLVEGPSDGFPLVYHGGTPSAAVEFGYLSQAAAASGLRTVTFSRPGYGESTPRPGRTVADVTGDVSAVLAALGLEQFVAFGWSGGGPHALACAALMPDTCRGAAALASAAPYEARGLEWLDGMGAEKRRGVRRRGRRAGRLDAVPVQGVRRARRRRRRPGGDRAR
jgi:pimeloyl-ACP methyl ester carboxylesterase